MGKNGKAVGDGVVSLRVSVPRGVIEFVKDLARFGGQPLTPKAWAEKELVAAAQATIDQLDDGEYLAGKRLKEKYGLVEKPGDP